MKLYLKRSASLIAALLIFALTASCGGNDLNNPLPNNDVGTTTVTSDEVTTAKVVNWESANLPKKDFNGKEFVILTRNTANLAHTWYLVAPDELTGDSLNDAMFNRNKKIEEIYNITISSYYSSSLKSDANNAINAGDDTYAAVFGSISDIYPLAQEGKLINFYDLDYIDLEAQWWDQSIVRDLTYNDTLFTLTGDISPATDSRVYTLVFNKDMCEELNLELPYQYVLDGTWTIDRFNKYISEVNYDVNGDTIMDHNDRWGFYSQNGCAWMMYFAGGGQVVSKSATGELSIAYNTERNIQLATEALKIAFDKTKTLMANQYVADNAGSWAAATSWFSSGGALFRSSVLEPIPRDLRSLDVNFGIVPFPKLDENQSQYYTCPEEYSIMFAVPVTADPEFSGLILESLAAESVSTVSPAFYDICLNGKVVRDEESKAMLDIIFNNKRFDIGYFNNIATFRTMINTLETSASTDVASAYAASLEKATADLAKICANFDGLK